MPEAPPADLTDLVSRLGLACVEQVRSVRGRVRRLARELPRFESVWVDALAQARLLTPFQAAEINAGRGSALEIGPYVLYEPLQSPGYATVYRAQETSGRREVRLTVVPMDRRRAGEIETQLAALVRRSSAWKPPGIMPLDRYGVLADRIWVASAYVPGRPAAQWLVRQGRFPAEAVLEIVRQMLVGLAAAEQIGLVHGDIGAGQLLIDTKGVACLAGPGLRGIIRPVEGYAHADLAPEAYDYLAPERITGGLPPTTASDLYACGCLWWQLLAGRPPLAGGNSLAKLRSGQTVQILDVRRLAPDTPRALAEAIDRCLQRDPRGRGESFARLAATLGRPTRDGQRLLARGLGPADSIRARPGARGGSRTQRAQGLLASASALPKLASLERPAYRRAQVRLAGAAALLVVAVGTWPQWSRWLPIAPAVAVQGLQGAGQATSPPFRREQAARHKPRAPRNVVPTDSPNSPRPPGVDRGQDLVLSDGRPLAVKSLAFQPGQTVRGRRGRRPLVLVPPGGLVVDVEGVHFENIDFAWQRAAAAGDRDTVAAAIVCLRASKAHFEGCSFQSALAPAASMTTAPAAILWRQPDSFSNAEESLPTASLTLRNCTMRGVGAGLRCQTVGALVIELANSLYLGPGPLVELDHPPRVDEPVALVMGNLTLRGASALVEYRYGRLDQEPGRVALHADGCALVPADGGGLLVLAGDAEPKGILRSLEWTGQGSVVSRRAPLALWRRGDGRVEVLRGDEIAAAGLVQTEVGFAGEADSGPAASRIVRWQAPLRSTEPPGIGETPLALPKLRR